MSPPPLLVDDPGHTHDITTAARAVFSAIFPTDPDDRWHEAAALIDPKTRDLRAWLSRDFFPLHIKRYSKSRRKAPIYWQLATPSASYSVWLYLHALRHDTLYEIQNDYLTPKLRHEERKLDTLRSETASGTGTAPAQRKDLAAQEQLVDDLRALLDEVKRVAPLFRPDLDDGVIINFAPLWRLVPHHRPWQKECKDCWDRLCAGDYDWSHLAMHLWPERVVPKCKTDRSLAIAHGLEDTFWAEDAAGKWKPRPEPARSVDDLVKERTSPAVKAALKSLLEAPAAGAGGGKRGGGRRKRGEGV